MKTDLYTKVVLTIIAISLSGIAIQMTTKEAHAQQQNLLFAESGALIVSICDIKLKGGRLWCAEVDKLEHK